MKKTVTELENIINASCDRLGLKGCQNTYMTMLLIGSGKLSLTQGASLLNISKNDLVVALNKFNIHYASI